ncbi:cell division protein FtsQ/DivIB [Alphaproteobacteria bacterium endosymbiont of Tiliacea citrago]|uniref:cell division protein FtsQ/DivIB n=1 Tax=Alphaproteobacteria bacterium endosymbiont of Tiliacea citrago TaxID=3077944 RepID=UPI00313C49D7
MKYKLNIILFILYVCGSFCVKYFGFFIPYNNCYTYIEKIAKKEKNNRIAGVIIKNRKNLEVIPVQKKIIGVFSKNNKIFFMDNTGNTFDSENDDPDDYIAISGNLKYWPIYYKELEKHPKILKKTFAATIFHYRIDLYLRPGILVKLNRSIKDLNDFHEIFPEYFLKENYYIDLRNTKKVGYAEYNIIFY